MGLYAGYDCGVRLRSLLFDQLASGAACIQLAAPHGPRTTRKIRCRPPPPRRRYISVLAGSKLELSRASPDQVRAFRLSSTGNVKKSTGASSLLRSQHVVDE